MGEYVQVGTGTSAEKDPYIAAKEAAKEAVKTCKETPKLSFVFCSSYYNPEKVAQGINEVLGADKWIGASTDAELSNKGFNKFSVVVTSIATEHMHFGIGYTKDCRRDPHKSGMEVIRMAMDAVQIDQHVDPYVQYQRMKTKDFDDIVKTPPYFVLTFASGAEVIDGEPVPGAENEFLEGITQTIGPFIPIFGASSSIDFEKYMNGEGRNFSFAQGEVIRSGAVLVFVSSNLYFSYAVQHGYNPTEKVAMITELDRSGYVIKKINGKDAVEAYAELVDVSKEELMENPFKYTLAHPLGVRDPSGKIYIKEAVPNPDGETMYSLCRLTDKLAVHIMDHDEESTLYSLKESVKTADIFNERDKIALSFVFDCSGRKALLKDGVEKEVQLLLEEYGNTQISGFYSFGEIGAMEGDKAQANNQTVTSIIIYDKLLTE